MEPAERQEKIPTESQKEKERVRDCKGNESLLQLGRKLLLGRGGEKETKKEKEGGTGVKRRQLMGERKKELQQFS